MKGLNKNEQVIAYLTQKHPEAGITVLMKLCYLIDLISFKKNNKSVLDFDYIRYKYGPFKAIEPKKSLLL